jgi:hypothetical protein
MNKPLSFEIISDPSTVLHYGSSSFMVTTITETLSGILGDVERTFNNHLINQKMGVAGGEIFTQNGVECSLMNAQSNGWVKGKARFKLVVEFCPESPEALQQISPSSPVPSQPESELDTLRRSFENR